MDAFLELADAPMFEASDFDVKLTFERVVLVDQEAEMRPTEFSTQCVDFLVIGKCFGTAKTMP